MEQGDGVWEQIFLRAVVDFSDGGGRQGGAAVWRGVEPCSKNRKPAKLLAWRAFLNSHGIQDGAEGDAAPFDMQNFKKMKLFQFVFASAKGLLLCLCLHNSCDQREVPWQRVGLCHGITCSGAEVTPCCCQDMWLASQTVWRQWPCGYPAIWGAACAGEPNVLSTSLCSRQ